MVDLIRLQKADKNLESKIKDAVKKNGVCIIDNFFTKEHLQSLREELDEVLSSNIEEHRDVKSQFTTMKRVSINSLKKFINIFDFCNIDLFKTLASDFYMSDKEDLIGDLYLHRDDGGADTNVQWHQDPQVLIKFFLYLNDTDKQSGAMHYSLGSHSDGIYRIKALRLMGESHPTFGRNYDDINNPVVLEGKAGSLLVFNTAGFHRAGEIDFGKKREVIRLHLFKRKSNWMKLINLLMSTFFLPNKLKIKINANLGLTGAEKSHKWFMSLEQRTNHSIKNN